MDYSREDEILIDDLDTIHYIDAYKVLEYKDRIIVIVEVDENKNPQSEIVIYKDNIVWWGYDK